MKKCRSCQIEKREADFHFHRSSADGRKNICKECYRAQRKLRPSYALDRRRKCNKERQIRYAEQRKLAPLLTVKKCSSCKQTFSVLFFGKIKQSPDGLDYHCKDCRCDIMRRFRHRNPDRLKAKARKRYIITREYQIERAKKWNKAHPGRSAANRRASYFGMPVEDYEAMHEAQNGVCAICRQPETQIHQKGKLKTLAVDHDHATGAIRELLCARCNNALGSFYDDPVLLETAAAYLRNHAENPSGKIIPFKKPAKQAQIQCANERNWENS